MYYCIHEKKKDTQAGACCEALQRELRETQATRRDGRVRGECGHRKARIGVCLWAPHGSATGSLKRQMAIDLSMRPQEAMVGSADIFRNVSEPAFFL